MGVDKRVRVIWQMIRGLIAIVIVAIIFLLTPYVFIAFKCDSKIYDDVESVPKKEYALLLGTTKYVSKGKINYYYKYRIDAAAKLYKSGKIKKILASGDNGLQYYNEPARMQKDLIKAGVPSRAILLDHAGFRTLDSVVRAKEYFKKDDFIIISQRFHLERALFIAKAKGIEAIGFEAKDIKYTKAYYAMQLREVFARFKAFLDIYILDTKPISDKNIANSKTKEAQ
jgi:SanA protein